MKISEKTNIQISVLFLEASIEAVHPIGRVRALYEFAASSEGELSIASGQELALLENDGSGWIYVEFKGAKGFVPLSYVETL